MVLQLTSVARPRSVSERIGSLAAGLSLLTLSSCSATTGGGIARENVTIEQPALSLPTIGAANAETGLAGRGIDREVAALFAVRPRLVVPARFALVEVDQDRLVAPAPEDVGHWNELAQRLGPGFGEFVALDPGMADLAIEVVQQGATAAAPRSALNDLRRGAALIKADYVIAYQVAIQTEERQNLLSATDWTLIGLWLVPSRNVKGEALARASVVDVRTGLPLGSASAQAERGGLARATDALEKRTVRAEAARREAVRLLTLEVEGLAATLLKEAQEDRQSIAD